MKVGDDVVITAQSAAAQDVPAGTMIGGHGYDNRLWIRIVSALKRLPDLLRNFRSLERRVEELEKKKQ